MKIDRFDGSPEMQPYVNGEYVRYSDYAELEAEVERLTKENRDYRRMISATHKRGVKHENCDKPFCPICEGGLFQCADCGAVEIETEEQICSSPLSRTGAVTEAARRVLEWAYLIAGDNQDEAEAKEEIESVEALKAAMESRHDSR